MNRIYFVYEPDENTGVMVAAQNGNQAKYMAYNDMNCEYAELRARLVKSGNHFYDEIENRNTGIEITGKGAIETEIHKVLDWEEFKQLAIDMHRGELFDEEDQEDLDGIITMLNTNVPPDRTCRICGCTQGHACPGGCYWVEEDLCNSCASECEEEDV